MKKNISFQIFALLFTFTSCDKVYLDGLEVINETNDSLYYSICTYNGTDSEYNMAYLVFDIGKNNQIKYKYVIDYKNNENAIKPNEIKKPFHFQSSWKDFAKKHNGLTFLFYKKETLEKLKPEVHLTEDNIYKRIDLSYEELEKINFIVKLK